MKTSRYNFLVPLEDGRTLAYNALSNGMCLIPGEVRELLEGWSEEGWECLSEETRSELRRGGFVVAGELDERDVVRIRYRQGQFGSLSAALTIAPTLHCNLACRYCFENPSRRKMDQKTRNAVVEFAGGLLPERGGGLSVTWYGGEPLLALDAIERLSEKFLALCEERQAEYSASIITNGTFLDGAVARRLAELRVQNAQVTIDGPREIHDVRRPLKSGGGSFARIVANLEEAVPQLPVGIRINVDRSNVDAAFAVVEDIQGRSWFDPERVAFHFGYVRRYTPACGCGIEEMLELTDFWDISTDLSERLRQRGLVSEPLYPELAEGCTATTSNAFVIGPEGELYRCWNHVGDAKQTVGTVHEPSATHPLTVAFLIDGFEQDEECLECRFLPVCTGGCVDVRRKAKAGLLPRKDCARWRYGFEAYLNRYFQCWADRQSVTR